MTDVKISLQNAITICGLIIACSVTYSAIASGVKRNYDKNTKQDERLEKVEYGVNQAALERQRNTSRFESIEKSNRRIEAWIQTLNETEVIKYIESGD